MTVKRSFVFIVILLTFVLTTAGVLSTLSFARARTSSIDRSRIQDPEIKGQSGALAHYLMGAIYDNHGESGKAGEEYQKALGFRDDISAIYIKKGSGLLVLGKLDEAESTLQKAIELDPEDVKAYLILAVIYTAKGEFVKAQQAYESALQLDSQNLRILTLLSDLFVIQKKLDKAAEVYERILEQKTDDAFIYFNLGIIYSKLGSLEKAKKSLVKAAELDPGYVEANMVLGFIDELSGRKVQAIEQYKKVIQLDPFNKEAYERLSYLYYKTGQIDKAVEQNRVLIQVDKFSPEPYLRMFGIYISEGDLARAESILKEALREGVSNAPVYAGLGFLASKEEDFKTAAEYYEVASEKDPGNETYRFYLAAAFERAGNFAGSIKILEGLVDSGKGSAEAYNYLGYMYVEAGENLERAVELIKKAVAEYPRNGAYLDSLAWAYYKMGKYQKALDTAKEAVSHLPDDPTVREHLGDIYFILGDFGNAANEWKEAIKLDPGNVKIKNKLKNLINNQQ